MADFLSALTEKILVFDGAMGTRLQTLLGGGPTCIDSLNLDSTYSEIVAVVHRSYLESGADVILTNTYGANSVKLGRYGHQSQVRAINGRGAEIARRCADQAQGLRFVGGSVGPLEIYSIRDEYTEDQLEQIYCEQISALVDGGVDLILLETFQDVQESATALRAALAFKKPVVFSIGGVQGGRTGTGADARELAMLATRAGAHVIGANCRGPYDILETIQLLAGVTSLPLLAMPNAGSPEIDRGRVAYHVEPERFYRYALKLADAGVSLIGGCCGTGPEHIAQISQALSKRGPAQRRSVSDVRVLELLPAPPPATPQEDRPNLVQEVFAKMPFVVSVEMRPGREKPLEEFLDHGRLLAAHGVHLFDIPDNAGARVTVDPLCSAMRLQGETRIPTIVHLSTSHRNLIATQSYLLGLWQAGIQSVLAVTGDHPNVGDHDKYASRVNDIKSSVNLMSLVGMLNEGRLFNESRCQRTNFVVGGGFNPVRGLTAQLKWLQRKMDAGAQFVFTQPVYREEDVDIMLEATQGLDIPILVGIMPLASKRNAEYFAAGKIPGIIIPPEILEKYENVEGLEDGQKLGLDLALELVGKIRHKVRGLYLLPSFGRDGHKMMVEIVKTLGLGATPAGSLGPIRAA